MNSSDRLVPAPIGSLVLTEDARSSAASSPDLRKQRLCANGKFLYAGEEKFWIRGVTYGTFALNSEGRENYILEMVKRDFGLMAAHGINAIRTYTVPPRWLLDLALHYGLRVFVGIPWEQHVAFLETKQQARDIEQRLSRNVRACAGHPAILAYAIGNEIPAPIVRWYGARRIEQYLDRLYHTAKAEDPGASVTYVNYPSTEYLQLPFLDFICFNVYLESQPSLDAYLARLQTIAGNRPLVMGEIGLDGRRHGEFTQARVLDWQVRSAFAAGCAGAFVFAWTDEWHRGGAAIQDWDFGLTTRDRRPKPALAVVGEAFAEVPFAKARRWPFISVVVCSYNGGRTIQTCLEHLLKLEYPNFEVIVVNDGSTDATPTIAESYGVEVITTENHGLSSARNTGLQAAVGEIVAYIDDDAYPDRHWLTYLAHTFMTSNYVGVGGPNVPPADDSPTADCVANAPGGPIHVLITDREAEHIPGCNMAFRKAALQAIGGFDPQFRAAGDDVDVCWRLQERGWTLGFNPAAMVWHHRRNRVRAYLRQQRGYGRAEALLEKKWPEKYNRVGHLTWRGRIYAHGLIRALGLRGRIYQGTWGSAPFQSLYEPAPGMLRSLPLMPEWSLAMMALAGLSVLGLSWTPLLLAFPLLGLAISLSILQAIHGARNTRFEEVSGWERMKRSALTAWLHFLQPLARLSGRLDAGLTPWRQRCSIVASVPHARTITIWSEQWRSPLTRIHTMETHLRMAGATVLRGGDFDRWDLEVRNGMLGSVRLLMAVEEHGAGKQMIRIRLSPLCAPFVVAAGALFLCLGIGAAIDGAWVPAGLLSGAAFVFLSGMLRQCGSAMAIILHTLQTANEGHE